MSISDLINSYENNPIIKNSTKYNLLNKIIFQSDKIKNIEYQELINSLHVIECVGSSDQLETLYKIYLPSIQVDYFKLVREYYELQKIPLGFIINRFEIRLVGNAKLEIYIDNNLSKTFSNPFYQLSLSNLSSDLRQDYNFYIYYGYSDDTDFSQDTSYSDKILISKF